MQTKLKWESSNTSRTYKEGRSVREIRIIEGMTSIEVHFAQNYKKVISFRDRSMIGEGECKSNPDEAT